MDVLRGTLSINKIQNRQNHLANATQKEEKNYNNDQNLEELYNVKQYVNELQIRLHGFFATR